MKLHIFSSAALITCGVVQRVVGGKKPMEEVLAYLVVYSASSLGPDYKMPREQRVDLES